MGAMSRRKGNRDMSEEMWLPVSACGGIYKENYMVSNHGRIWSKLTNKIINGGVNKRGYKHIGLRSGGERKNVNLHKIVAHAFIGELPTPDYQIDHIDGDKLNNCVINLRYVTASQNIIATFENGRVGYRKPEKLSRKYVDEIRKKIKEGMMQKLIAEEYGISQAMVSRIKSKQSWAR